jgi:electron transport complex protein RnfE
MNKAVFTKGILKENPVFVVLLGLCPALGVSGQVINALGMGAGVIFVLLGSNIVVSLLKDFIPSKVRIPSYIVIIATFVTVVQLIMEAFVPTLYQALGVFLPLIVVNCVILGRAEAFASKNNLSDSILDALGMGIGFTFALLIIALVREVFGNGTISLFEIPVPFTGGNVVLFPNGVWEIPIISNSPVRVLAFPAGAMLVMGYLKGFFNFLELAKTEKKNEARRAA